MLKPKGGTWRSRKRRGRRLPVRLRRASASTSSTGTAASRPGSAAPCSPQVFSREIDDEVFSTLFYFDGGKTGADLRQLVRRVLPQDDHARDTSGARRAGSSPTARSARSICADTATIPDGYEQGWNVRYTTELTEPVWFYLRGEEYSAQIEHFVERGRGRARGRAQRLRERGRDRPRDRDDDRRRGARARRRAPAELRGAPAPRRRRAARCFLRRARDRTPPARESLMDRLLFGDNQFFGVNHMSEEKARAQAMRFQDHRTP